MQGTTVQAQGLGMYTAEVYNCLHKHLYSNPPPQLMIGECYMHELFVSVSTVYPAHIFLCPLTIPVYSFNLHCGHGVNHSQI